MIVFFTDALECLLPNFSRSRNLHFLPLASKEIIPFIYLGLIPVLYYLLLKVLLEVSLEQGCTSAANRFEAIPSKLQLKWACTCWQVTAATFNIIVLSEAILFV